MVQIGSGTHPGSYGAQSPEVQMPGTRSCPLTSSQHRGQQNMHLYIHSSIRCSNVMLSLAQKIVSFVTRVPSLWCLMSLRIYCAHSYHRIYIMTQVCRRRKRKLTTIKVRHMWFTPTRLFISDHLAEPNDVTDWRHRVVELTRSVFTRCSQNGEGNFSTTINLALKVIHNDFRFTVSNFLGSKLRVAVPCQCIADINCPISAKLHTSMKATSQPPRSSTYKEHQGCSL
jgi:hypothetical protein